MCQFAITHEGEPHVSRSKLVKECVKQIKFTGFFCLCTFTSNEPQLLFLFFFYNNNKNNNVQLYNRAMTAPFYLLSCCYVAPLNGNWRFSASCCCTALNFRSFIIGYNEKFLPLHSVTQGEYQSLFASFILLSHGGISNKGRLRS